MKLRNHIFFLVAVVCVALASCSEAYKKKTETAQSFLDDMMAESVTVGYLSEVNNSEKMAMTTLSFQDASPELADAERERRANRVAYEFYSALTADELKDETHVKIICATSDLVTYEYLFDIEGLAHVDEYQKVADDMVEACIAMDSSKIKSLKDDNSMPDDQMHIIYDVNTYNDSVYAGKGTTTKPLGFRLTDGADDENLKLYSANYEVGTAEYVTRYTINVDRKTKKVVYLWMKTDPR